LNVEEGAEISSEPRKNLVMVAKTLQSVSNGVIFGAKEEYRT
jgi:hypothetical protein